jgi:hypothetical protein
MVPTGDRLARHNATRHAVFPLRAAAVDDVYHRLYECPALPGPAPEFAKTFADAGRRSYGLVPTADILDRAGDYVYKSKGRMYASDTDRAGLWVESEDRIFFDPDRPFYVDRACYHGRRKHLAISGLAVQLDYLGRPDTVITAAHLHFVRQ